MNKGREDGRSIIGLSLPRHFLKLIPIFLVILATLFVYWPVQEYDFIHYDDGEYVSENPKVQAGLTLQSIRWAFTNIMTGNWHPMTWLSHMLDCELFGLNPGAHHLTNLFFHLANTLLLLWVLNRMTGRFWASSFIAALFALHPLHVEPVVWLADRKDLLSTFFGLITVGMYVSYVERPRLYQYLLTLFVFALSLMSKPMVITLPFVLLLLDYWPLGRLSFTPWGGHPLTTDQNQGDDRGSFPFSLVLEKVPFFILSVVWSVLTFLAQSSAGAVNSPEILPLEIRLANAIVSYARYIGKMIWPHNLAILYPYPDTVPIWQVVLAGILLLAISVLVIRWARSRPYLAVGWLWYLGTLIPVIGLVQAGPQAMADRFTYVPFIGLFIMIAIGIPSISIEFRHQKIALALSASLLLFTFMVLARQQVRYWENSITLFEHTLAVTDKNFVIHNNLGTALAQQGKTREAMAHYAQALQIKPSYVEAHYNLGKFLAEQGKIQEAITHYTQALRMKPDFDAAHNNLGNLLARQGKIREAADHYIQALRSNPNYAQAHYNLAVLQAQQGRIQEAIASYTQALEIEPHFAEAHYNLGVILTQQGNNQEAIAHYTQAIRIKLDYPEAHNNLAQLLEREGKTHEAITHYRQALRFKPDYTRARNNLQNLLAKQGMTQGGAIHLPQTFSPDLANALSKKIE